MRKYTQEQFDALPVEIVRRQRAGSAVDRAERIFNQIMRLTEEQHRLMSELNRALLTH